MPQLQRRNNLTDNKLSLLLERLSNEVNLVRFKVLIGHLGSFVLSERAVLVDARKYNVFRQKY